MLVIDSTPRRARAPRARRGALFLAALGAQACGSSAAPLGGAPLGGDAGAFARTPFAIVNGDQAQLRIEVRTAPVQPPERGIAKVQYSVVDENGMPVDGLTLEVVPWMPAMGHGTSVVPVVSAAGRGIYVIDEVSLFMPGRWELRTVFSGSTSDHAAPAFDVP
jgi:YtkA-like